MLLLSSSGAINTALADAGSMTGPQGVDSVQCHCLYAALGAIQSSVQHRPLTSKAAKHMQWLPQIPMLPLSDELQASMMSSIDVRAELSPEDLPSAVLYTFVNTHKSLHCVTTSEDGTLVAGGVFNKRQPADLPASLLPLLKMQQHSGAALARSPCMVPLLSVLCIAWISHLLQ